jgi:hypothetical protein
MAVLIVAPVSSNVLIARYNNSPNNRFGFSKGSMDRSGMLGFVPDISDGVVCPLTGLGKHLVMRASPVIVPLCFSDVPMHHGVIAPVQASNLGRMRLHGHD